MKPNFLFILMDDLGWRDLSVYGSTFYETPHLDRLAARGMRFTDGYASCPVCSPSRASIMSGKYPARVGVTDWIDWGGGWHPMRGRLIDAPYCKALPQSEVSIATALREGGYRTWHIGKWHLGGPGHLPTQHGFDVNVGGCEWGMPLKGYFSPYGIPVMTDGPTGEYLPERLTDEAVALLRQKSDKPFFLNLWHYLVHTPIQAKPDRVAYFADKAKAMGLDILPALEEGEHFPMERKRTQRVTRRLIQSDPVYAAMVFHMDESIGRLISVLEETGQMDNTYIIFTSDNGGLATAEGSPTTNRPLQEGKGWMYDGGTRVPLLVAGPGIAAGSVCSDCVTSTDFNPTMISLAGLPLRPQQHCVGESIVPLLRGTGRLQREAIYWHYPHYGNQGGTPGASIRMGDYKLIEFFEDNHVELYNLRTDIAEAHDLAHEEPQQAATLLARLHAWQASVCAKQPQMNPEWRDDG